MNLATRERLSAAEKWCNDNDKSTAFMIQFMQDEAKASFDTVMNYLREKATPLTKSQAKKLRKIAT